MGFSQCPSWWFLFKQKAYFFSNHYPHSKFISLIAHSETWPSAFSYGCRLFTSRSYVALPVPFRSQRASSEEKILSIHYSPFIGMPSPKGRCEWKTKQWPPSSPDSSESFVCRQYHSSTFIRPLLVLSQCLPFSFHEDTRWGGVTM